MRKALPVGISDYRYFEGKNYYVVDKTMLIAEFLKRSALVTLITRPRRFGKTINMSMMAEFFDCRKSSAELFRHTKIMDSEYAREINQYPTIFISFASCKGEKESILMNEFYLLQREMGKYLSLLPQVTDEDLKLRYEKLYQDMSKGTDFSRIQLSINVMCELLYHVYEKPVMLFIDEYDTPFMEAKVSGCYEEIRSAMAGMLSNALKTNPYLKQAMITGIQRIAKENIFSGLNNLAVFTVADKGYGEYFGFTKEETKALLSAYDLSYSEEVKLWYDGYHIGNAEVYNPWSLINYAQEEELKPYWVNTSSNLFIRQALQGAKESFKKSFDKLMKDEYVDTELILDTSFYEQSLTPCLWGLLVNAGYLTIETALGNDRYRLRVPNKEVGKDFKRFCASRLQIEDETTLSRMLVALKEADQEEFIDSYRDFLMALPSANDLIQENSNHCFFIGLCSCLLDDKSYEIISNREAGTGRADIILKSRNESVPSYVIEFKHTKNKRQKLNALAEKAVKQIAQKQYDDGIGGWCIHIGLAHDHKQAEMKWLTVSSSQG